MGFHTEDAGHFHCSVEPWPDDFWLPQRSEQRRRGEQHVLALCHLLGTGTGPKARRFLEGPANGNPESTKQGLSSDLSSSLVRHFC